jgi:hypothetical protein
LTNGSDLTQTVKCADAPKCRDSRDPQDASYRRLRDALRIRLHHGYQRTMG